MRALLIQDDAKLTATVKVSLEQQGYSVDTAAVGDGLAVVDQYDMIVIDVARPDGDGVTPCRELRRKRVAAPVLILSVRDSTADRIAGLDAGADDYVTKPFETEELLARLRSLRRRAAASEAVLLRAGDLVMNLDEHQVTRGGINVKLSAKEFDLLEYMIRHPRKLLTRTMISESVWDMNYESSSNVIDVYVSSLRRKVDRGAVQPRIETVIGKGYRFVPEAEQPPSPPAAT